MYEGAECEITRRFHVCNAFIHFFSLHHFSQTFVRSSLISIFARINSTYIIFQKLPFTSDILTTRQHLFFFKHTFQRHLHPSNISCIFLHTFHEVSVFSNYMISFRLHIRSQLSSLL